MEKLKNYDDNRIIETIAKIVIIGFMFYGVYLIVKPFVAIIIWAVIIAVTIDPIITIGEKKLNISRSKLSFAFAFFVIALILAPIVGGAISFNDTAHSFMNSLHAGTFAIPPPSEKILKLPLIGDYIYNIWFQASNNLNGLLVAQKEEVIHYARTALLTIGNGLFVVVSFMISVAISAVFTSKNITSTVFATTIAKRLAGDHGLESLRLATQTIRSVMQGVIGIAMIQAVVGYIGFMIVGLPFPVAWALALLLVAIAQLPALIVMLPAILYVFSTQDTTPAVLFTIFSVILGLSDNVLKPLLLGRGVDVPMVVILLGAIGGMLVWGILGLFIGSVLLAVVYQIFILWLQYEAKAIEISQKDQSSNTY